MAEIRVGDRKRIEVLRVDIGDASYNVPLAGSLTRKETSSIKSNDDVSKFFEKYIPKKVMDGLTWNDIHAIYKAWSDASTADAGVTPGESRASHD